MEGDVIKDFCSFGPKAITFDDVCCNAGGKTFSLNSPAGIIKNNLAVIINVGLITDLTV